MCANRSQSRSLRGAFGVAGVRAGAGHHHAQADGDGGEERDGGHHRARDARQGGKLHGPGLARAAVGPVHQQGREDHEGHGDEEVQAHHPRVQLGQHRDAADDGLGRDAGEQAEGQQEEVAAFLAEVPQVHQHHHGDGRQRERQEPVAEFDDSVDPHFRGGRQGCVRAARPRGAAKARGGQADGAAGHHQDDLADEGQHGQPPDRLVDGDGQPGGDSGDDPGSA